MTLTTSPQVVSLTNSGSAALNITSISLAGSDAADFSQANMCGSSLAPGGSCNIAILMTPSGAGSRTASLNIVDNADGSPQSVLLSGTGTHDVILTWSAGTDSGTTGYAILRGTAPSGEGSAPVNSSPVTDTTYVDVNVQPGQTYYYVVAVVGPDGSVTGPKSNEASATVPSP